VSYEPDKKPAGITIKSDARGARISNTTVFGLPGTVGVAIEDGAKDYKINDISVSGGADFIEYVSPDERLGKREIKSSLSEQAAAANKSTTGWSRAFEQNSIFGKVAVAKINLSDARAKLDRAREHIADVDRQLNDFLATDFYQLSFEADEERGRTKVIFGSRHPPDRRIHALIGDAVGNLRSVLDYITVAFVSLHTDDIQKIGFPNADDAAGFEGQTRATKGFGLCDVSVQNFFIADVQAYNGGNREIFWIVNKLRNIDKHRLLLTTVQIAGLTVSGVDGNGGTWENATFNISAGESGLLVDAPYGHLDFQGRAKPIFKVTLEEHPYICGCPVLDFLREAAEATEDLLTEISTRF